MMGISKTLSGKHCFRIALCCLAVAACSGCAAYLRYNEKVANDQQQTMDSMKGQHYLFPDGTVWPKNNSKQWDPAKDNIY